MTLDLGRLADIPAFIQLQAERPLCKGPLFHIHIDIENDPEPVDVSGRFNDACDAAEWALEIGEIASNGNRYKLNVRPDVETSVLHGRMRYPRQLHDKATTEAWMGWFQARDAAARDRADHKALVQQVRMDNAQGRAHG